ncbi:MAG: hypothetical protein ACTH4E_00860, partial [Streptococcus thermophilus]
LNVAVAAGILMFSL